MVGEGEEWGEGTDCKKARENFFGMVEMFSILIVEMITQLYLFVNTY